MPIIGLLVGLAVGAGARVAQSRGHRWVFLVLAVAFFVAAVLGFINGYGRTSSAVTVGVILGYFGVLLAELVRARRSSRSTL